MGDYYWGLYRHYYRDLFPHSLPSTREPQIQSGGRSKSSAETSKPAGTMEPSRSGFCKGSLGLYKAVIGA